MRRSGVGGKLSWEKGPGSTGRSASPQFSLPFLAVPQYFQGSWLPKWSAEGVVVERGGGQALLGPQHIESARYVPDNGEVQRALAWT